MTLQIGLAEGFFFQPATLNLGSKFQHNPVMSQILEHANKIALALKFPRAIEAVSKWRIPHTKVQVAGFGLTKVGKLTSAESVVIQGFRASVGIVATNQRLGVLTVMMQIGEKFGLETVSQITELVSDNVAFKNKAEELNIGMEVITAWDTAIDETHRLFDVTQAIGVMKNDIVTFFMAMRYASDWDYADTQQLTDKEFEAIYEFCLEEQGIDAVEAESDKDAENNIPVKKP